jgi:hypothetical protein
MLYPVGAMAYQTIENRSDFTVYHKIDVIYCSKRFSIDFSGLPTGLLVLKTDGFCSFNPWAELRGGPPRFQKVNK